MYFEVLPGDGVNLNLPRVTTVALLKSLPFLRATVHASGLES